MYVTSSKNDAVLDQRAGPQLLIVSTDVQLLCRVLACGNCVELTKLVSRQVKNICKMYQGEGCLSRRSLSFSLNCVPNGT
jgi:hypothetical protein